MSEPDVQTSSTVVEPVNFVDRAGTPINGNLETAAIDFVKSTASMTASDRDDWKVRSVKRGKDGRDHVRLDQVYAGIKVWGADVVVHADETSFRGVDGIVAKSIDENLAITPKLDAAKAIAIAKGLYDAGIADRSAKLAYSRESAELVIFPGPKGTARLAWHTEFFTELQAGMKPGLWNNIIAADSGEVLESFNAIHTLSQASGPGGNPKVPRTWVDALDVEPATGTDFQMNTARLLTVNMNGSSNDNDPGTIVVGPLAAIGDAPINDAHGFAEITLNMMAEWFGLNSIDNDGFVIRSRVHYGVAYENAFWDGSQMTYGDGASTFYPLSGAVDVVAHEISHGFTTFHSDLIYAGESGGSNEAFSDIAGAVGEFFSEGAAGDFDVGEDIFRAQNEALRYMCDPPRDGISIDHYADFTAGMDVHFSSGIPNKAFCHAARRLSSGSETGPATVEGVRRAATAWYEANANYWTAGTTFRQACQGILSAAGALGFSEEEIGYLRTSWDDVGVLNCDGPPPPPTCDETLTAAAGTVTSPGYNPPNGTYPNNFRRTYCIQPANGLPATLTFTDFFTEEGYDFVTIVDGAIPEELGTYDGTNTPPPATSTWIAIRFTTDSSVVERGWSATWTTTGEPPPNQAPTVSITAPSDGSTVFGTVNVTATAADVDGTVASVVFTLPDGTTVTDTAAPFETTWVTSTVANGDYPISAVATDDDGATGSSTVTVTVNNIPCTSDVFTSTDVPVAIPDFDTTGITSALPIVGNGVVASLSLSLNIQHTYQGDLAVFLVSPSGARYRIHYRTGGTTDNLVITDRAIPAAAGQTIEGTWSLEVSDRARVDRGSLTAWSLNVVGSCQ